MVVVQSCWLDAVLEVAFFSFTAVPVASVGGTTAPASAGDIMPSDNPQ